MATYRWESNRWRHVNFPPPEEPVPHLDARPAYAVGDVVEFDFVYTAKGNGKQYRSRSPEGGGKVKGIEYNTEMGLYYYIESSSGHSAVVQENQVLRVVRYAVPQRPR